MPPKNYGITRLAGGLCALIATLYSGQALADDPFAFLGDGTSREDLLTTAELQAACRRVAACPLDHAGNDLWKSCAVAGKLDVKEPLPTDLPAAVPKPAEFKELIGAGCRNRWSDIKDTTWTFDSDSSDAKIDLTVSVGEETLTRTGNAFDTKTFALDGEKPIDAVIKWKGPVGESHSVRLMAMPGTTDGTWTISETDDTEKSLIGGGGPGIAVVGLADFLLERTQAEVAAWLSSAVGAKLCKEPKKGEIDASNLFPETCDLLTDDEKLLASLAERHFSVLKETVTGDVVAFPRNLSEELLRVGKASDSQKQLLVALAVSGRTAELAIDGVQIQDAIAGWAREKPAQWPDGTAFSFASDGNSQLPAALYLVSELVALSPDIHVTMKDGRLEVEAEEKRPGSFAVATWSTLSHDPHMPAGLTIDSAKVTVLARIASDLHDGIEEVVQRRMFTMDRSKYQDAAGKLSAMATDVGHLSGLVATGADAVKELLPGDDEEQKKVAAAVAEVAKSTKSIAVKIAAREYGPALAAVGRALIPKDGDEGQSPPALVLRVASMAASIAGAETAEEAKEGFQAIAAPIGGYRDKRRTDCKKSNCKSLYGTLNAYVGVSGGVATGPTVSPVATIGPEFGWRLGGTNLAFHASPVDVGQLVALRFDEADVDPDAVDWREFFVPTGQISVGLGPTPFVAGIQGGWTPFAESNAHIGVVLATDLHLLP